MRYWDLYFHSPRLLKEMWGMKGELKDTGIKID